MAILSVHNYTHIYIYRERSKLVDEDGGGAGGRHLVSLFRKQISLLE